MRQKSTQWRQNVEANTLEEIQGRLPPPDASVEVDVAEVDALVLLLQRLLQDVGDVRAQRVERDHELIVCADRAQPMQMRQDLGDELLCKR